MTIDSLAVVEDGLSSPHLPIEEVQFAKLPPIVRVILTTDGTVSSLLRHWFQEQIKVNVIEQREASVTDPTAGDDKLHRVIDRKIMLTGQPSNRLFLSAHSLLYMENLPPELFEQIQSHPQGIGGALNDTRTEHLRQVSGWGLVSDADAVWREYRVLMQGRLVMQIHESFPLNIFR